MSSLKCVVEGCSLEYDVICSFSFYNTNISTDNENSRQEWIEGAMQEQSECLWRHVSLQLCGYHFELDNQGLWVDSPMLPELLTVQDKAPAITQTPADKRRYGVAARGSYQSLYEKFIQFSPKAAEVIRMDHNYCIEPPAKEDPESVSRLNVRQLVDTLGYLSLKNLQRKQLWVVKVETDKAEASITQSEQVITKMQDPKQIIEILPQTSSSTNPSGNEVLQIMEDTTIADNFIYEIAEEQEISMDEVKEIPADNKEWIVNILPDESKPRYAYIKHCNTGKKKRHFTADMNEITLHAQGDFENYYILPDVDPSVGVEITTSYEPDNYIVEEYQHLVLDERPRKRTKNEHGKKKNKRPSTGREHREPKDGEDWVIQNNISFDESEDYEDKKAASRVRRKNKKYLGYDFVT